MVPVMTKSLKRIGWGLLVLILLALLFLLVWEPLVATPAKAPPAKTYDVEILRDDYGVPHIYGKTDADTAHGIAYAHAEDDFSTLQDVILMTRSRLGALNGQEGAATDFVAHLLDVEGTVERKYDAQPEDVKALLEAYAAGLNLYAEKHPEEIKMRNTFPVNGRDVAAGFVLRSPFFFGLAGVLGKLVKGEPHDREGGADLSGATESATFAPFVTPVGTNPDANG